MNTEKDDRTDEELLERSRVEPELFAHLVRRYEAAFLRKARLYLRSEDDALDVVQETFVKIYLNAAKFKTIPGAKFSSWGYVILKNTAFTRYEKRKREGRGFVELESQDYESLGDDSHLDSFRLEFSDYVLSVLSRMPAKLARVLELHFILDTPQEVIAQQEGVSVGAIKTRVHRAKAEFRTIAAKFAPF